MVKKAVRGRKVAQPQRRGEAFVRAVLDVTLEQLAQVGFERLSIPEIAALVGVNKTSVYRHWPTKDELVRAALGSVMAPPVSPPDTGGVREDLLVLARSVARFVASPQGRSILRLLVSEGASPEVRALASSIHRAPDVQGPREVVRRAIQRGQLPGAVDGDLVLSTIAGAIVHRVLVEQAPVTLAYLKGVVDLVLFGAVGAPPSPGTTGKG